MRKILKLAARVLLCALTLSAVAVSVILSAERGSAWRGNLLAEGELVTTTPTPPPMIRFSFLALDESGHAVTDLVTKDLIVTDNGASQSFTLERDDLPTSSVLVVDNSGSMRQSLDAVAYACREFITLREPGEEISLERFVSSNHVEVLEDFTQNQIALADALSEMRIEGGETDVVDAVYDAARRVAKRNADGAHHPAVFLITDGDDRTSAHNREQLLKLLPETGVQVFVVGLTEMLDKEGGFIRKNPRESATELLEAIAAESGGRAFFPRLRGKKDAGLGELMKEIARDLHSQYVVSYELPREAADGKFHRVQIKDAHTPGRPKLSIFARPGYVAAGGEGQSKDKQ